MPILYRSEVAILSDAIKNQRLSPGIYGDVVPNYAPNEMLLRSGTLLGDLHTFEGRMAGRATKRTAQAPS